jgi:outer membrane protein TolC
MMTTGLIHCRKALTLTAFTLCLLALAQTGFAQSVITLQEAINLTLKKNFDIQIARNNVEASTINNHIGVAGGLPLISGTFSDQESVVNVNQELNTGTKISRNGTASNSLQGNVTGSQLLYNGYRVVATKDRLETLQKQSQQLLNLQIQNAIAAVMMKYYDVVRQQSYTKTLLQSINLSQKQLEIIEVKQSVGLANNADLFQAQIDLNTRKQDLQAQQLIIDQAKADLLNLMSVNPDSAIVIKDTILTGENIVLENVLNFIYTHPEIVAADDQVKISQLIEKETAAQRYPSVRVNTGLNYGRTQTGAGNILLNQNYGPFIGLSVAVPIYNGGALKRQEQVAAINTRNARLNKESLVQDYQANTVKTFKAYINSLEQLKMQQATYNIAEQLVNLSMQRYELGVTTIVELREAQKSFEDAGYRLVNLNYTAKVAEIELKRISSQLGLR